MGLDIQLNQEQFLEIKQEIIKNILGNIGKPKIIEITLADPGGIPVIVDGQKDKVVIFVEHIVSYKKEVNNNVEFASLVLSHNGLIYFCQETTKQIKDMIELALL